MVPLTINAPAKINLHLHITGRRADGYHILNSWVIFTRLSDHLTLSQATADTLEITGPFAESITRDPPETNLVMRALRLLRQNHALNGYFHAHLTKNIPAGAGLGGGSSDAAAVISALRLMNPDLMNKDDMHKLALQLGSDVPVFLSNHAVIMEGVGDESSPSPVHPAVPLVLIYPSFPSSTPATYAYYKENHAENFSTPVAFPDHFASVEYLCLFLRAHTANDLYQPAIALNPDIALVTHALESQSDCLLARMSGSGSCCFGIFENTGKAERAADLIKKHHPAWHVMVTQSL
ncbi:MAG: 4-(cytidine 5'-diphospho)-2-C-methyl-D-erythritol kinase [Pseudobdellovibrionaceae bacterium]